MLTRPAFILAASALAATACDGAPRARHAHADSVPSLTLSAGERLGSATDPDAGFSRIASVDVDRDGNIYVLDAVDRQIRVYDPGLQPLRRIGRPGQGPGEFERVPRFGVLGDTVWTVESLSWRVTLFSRSGDVLSTGRAQGVQVLLPGTVVGTLSPHALRPDGRFISDFTMVSSSRGDPPSGLMDEDSIRVPRVRFDVSGGVVDTVGWDAKPDPRMWRPARMEPPDQYRMFEMDGRRFSIPDPPSELPWWIPLNDGRVMVQTPLPSDDGIADLSAVRVGLAGDTVYHTVIRYAPVRYRPIDLDSIALRASRGMAASASAQATDPAVAERIRAQMKFPPYRLPTRAPWVAQDESVWLPILDQQGEPTRWVILDARGRIEGAIALPLRVRPNWRKGEVLWATELDEDDVPWLVKYTLRPERR